MEPAKQATRRKRQIGKYRLVAALGQGGMAKVYLALMAGPAGFNKLLVIKALRDDMGDAGGDFVTMFLDEARLAAQLSHPNVVQTYEVGEAEGRYFIAMEYLEGQALRTAQRRLLPTGGVPLHEELRILAEAARGLHYAHNLTGFDGERLNVVHRDVSPQNIFVTYEGLVKVLDFGIAKTGDPQRQTQVGVIKGKADYIAPEQIRGERVDRRADIFSLGAMMWEALSGKRFAGGPNVSDITKIHNRVTGAEPNIADVAPDTPAALIAICERALALDPDDRYATGEEFASAIDEYLRALPTPPNAKSLAAIMQPAFLQEREKLRALVDSQVQLVQSYTNPNLGSTGTLPVLDRSQTRTRSGVTGLAGGAHHSSMLPLAPLPREASEDSTHHPIPEAPAAGTASVAPERGSSRLLAFVMAGAAVAAGVFFGLTGGDHGAPGVATEPAPPVGEAQTTHAAAQGPADGALGRPSANALHLRVEVDPAHATVLLDGARLARLPFEASLEKDSKLHRLEARADGYQPLDQVLTFDRDQKVVLTLTPQSQPVAYHSASKPKSSGSTGSRSSSSSSASRAAPEPTPSALAESAAVPEPDAPAKHEPRKRRQVVAPGQDLLGSTAARTPAAPRIDLEDPYQ